MTLYAQVNSDIVLHVVELPFPPEDVFPSELAANYVKCTSAVSAGWLYSDKKFSAPISTSVPFAEIVAQLKVLVDQSAESERLKYITPGTGQAMTYQQKVAEAQAFKAATDPQASDYPVLSSEVGITADTLDEVANIVLAAFAQWQQIGAMIESIRLGAKRDIDAAEDEAAARAIVDAIVWPSEE